MTAVVNSFPFFLYPTGNVAASGTVQGVRCFFAFWMGGAGMSSGVTLTPFSLTGGAYPPRYGRWRRKKREPYNTFVRRLSELDPQQQEELLAGPLPDVSKVPAEVRREVDDSGLLDAFAKVQNTRLRKRMEDMALAEYLRDLRARLDDDDDAFFLMS